MAPSALLAFAASGLALVMALAQLAPRRRVARNYIVATLYGCVAIILLGAFFELAPLYNIYPHLLRIHVPFLALVGPLLYFWYRTQFVESAKLHWSDLWHLLPSLICVIGLVPFYAANVVVKRQAVQKYMRFEPSATDFFEVMAFGSLAVYLILLAYRVAPLWRMRETVSRFFLLQVLMVMTIGLLICLDYPLRSYVPSKIAVVLVFATLASGILINVRYPEFFQELRVTLKNEKYHRTLLKGVDLKAASKRLDQTMVTERAYRAADLTLAGLATAVELSQHQLSEFLNSRLRQNFSSFVNSYRVNEAAELLLASSDRTILSIAYEVGFSSLATFNAAFLAQKGMTPSAFRAKNLTD